MLALMGPSGAGKSTLLDVLSSRKSAGTTYGSVYVGAKTRCYVMQDDCHLGNLTVIETLRYASLLRNPRDWTEEDHGERVKYLVDTLGLGHVESSLVGDSFTRGISGGQLKRLSIAVEAVTLPELIFLDEPTSGLDSSISLEVMDAVRRLCNSGGRSAVCTIHQPSVNVFGLFDRLLLLSEGRVVYEGDAGAAKPYFERLGYRPEEGSSNPADFICEVAGGAVCGGGTTRTSALENLTSRLQGSWKGSLRRRRRGPVTPFSQPRPRASLKKSTTTTGRGNSKPSSIGGSSRTAGTTHTAAPRLPRTS